MNNDENGTRNRHVPGSLPDIFQPAPGLPTPTTPTRPLSTLSANPASAPDGEVQGAAIQPVQQQVPATAAAQTTPATPAAAVEPLPPQPQGAGGNPAPGSLADIFQPAPGLPISPSTPAQQAAAQPVRQATNYASIPTHIWRRAAADAADEAQGSPNLDRDNTNATDSDRLEDPIPAPERSNEDIQRDLKNARNASDDAMRAASEALAKRGRGEDLSQNDFDLLIDLNEKKLKAQELALESANSKNQSDARIESITAQIKTTISELDGLYSQAQALLATPLNQVKRRSNSPATNEITDTQTNQDSTVTRETSPAAAQQPAQQQITPPAEQIHGVLSIKEKRNLTRAESEELDTIFGLALDEAKIKVEDKEGNKKAQEGKAALVDGLVSYKVEDIDRFKAQNPNFIKQAVAEAVKGADATKKFFDKEVGKINFVSGMNIVTSTKEDKDGKAKAGLTLNQMKETANAYERFVNNDTNIIGVATFVHNFQENNKDSKGKKQEFPLNLITDVKNEGMVKLVAQDPETAAIGLQAFKDREGKGLNAFKAVDLGKGMEAAMLSAAKHIDPKQKAIAANNIANMVMNTAAGSRYELLSGKVKMDQAKLDAIKKGVKQDTLQEKPAKVFAQVFRDKTGLGGTAGDKGKVVGPFGGLVRKQPINLHPVDNAMATWGTIKGLKTANPFKAGYNLVKLAVYNIPKLLVSALIATPIALIRTATQMSTDKKNLRLQNVATLAAKYPKSFQAIAQAIQKDGKSKVHKKDILKAFSSLGNRAQTIENSTLSVKAIKEALHQKAGHANYINNESKKILGADLQANRSILVKGPIKAFEWVKREFGVKGPTADQKDLKIANEKLGVGKGPTVIDNLMRGGNAVGGLTELLDKDALGKLKKEYGSKVFAAVENVLKANDIEPSAKVMDKVLSGLGQQAAKSLESTTVSQESIEKNLVRTMDKTPNTPKLIEALAKGGEISDQAAIAFNNLGVKAANNPNAVIDARRAPNPQPMPDIALAEAANAFRQNNAVTTGGAATTPVLRSAENIAKQGQGGTQVGGG